MGFQLRILRLRPMMLSSNLPFLSFYSIQGVNETKGRVRDESTSERKDSAPALSELGR